MVYGKRVLVLLLLVLVAGQLACTGGEDSGFPVSRHDAVGFLDRTFDAVQEFRRDNSTWWFATMSDDLARGSLAVAGGQIVAMTIEAETRGVTNEIGSRNFGILMRTLDFLFPNWGGRGDWFDLALSKMFDGEVSTTVSGALVTIRLDKASLVVSLDITPVDG